MTLGIGQGLKFCGDTDRDVGTPVLPARARLPVNRCNLPAVVLGGLTFQRNPSPLVLDGVPELHAELFTMLDELETPAERAERFADYMTVHFLLEEPEAAGLDPEQRRNRAKADYLRVLRGWSFDSDSREGAVLKGWAESRFGLLPRHHREPLADTGGPAFRAYCAARAEGLYNTNALESQLDLVFHYCQNELARRAPRAGHITLYRGMNRLQDTELPAATDDGLRVFLFNNINSFTSERERADEFGDAVLEVEVPAAKVFCFSGLLPGRMAGEDEFIVIGGAYAAEVLV